MHVIMFRGSTEPPEPFYTPAGGSAPGGAAMESGGFLPRPVPCAGSEPADSRGGGWRAARFLLGNLQDLDSVLSPHHL